MHVFCPTYYWTCSFNALELMLEMPLNSTSNKRLIWKQYRTVLASHHTYALVMLPSAAHHHEEGLQNGLFAITVPYRMPMSAVHLNTLHALQSNCQA